MHILRVGDPHAKVASLDEMKKLFHFIAYQATTNKVDRIEILGDLFHTHNVIRLEVIEFWVWALDLLSQICETVVIVGNHDQTGDYSSTFSALSVFGLMNKKNLTIVEKPTLIGIYGYIPYTHSSDSFIAEANKLADAGAKVLVCHQTFQGSKYESGIFAPDGIPSGQWSERFEHVISGHIHSEQNFGNFIYPGTARWDSVVDANRRKGIWLFEHGSNGKIQRNDHFSTEQVCSPIKLIEYREGDAFPTWNAGDRVSVEIIGRQAWVDEQKHKFTGKCAVKTKNTDKTAAKEMRKAGKNFEHFLKELFNSTKDKEALVKKAKEIGIV